MINIINFRIDNVNILVHHTFNMSAGQRGNSSPTRDWQELTRLTQGLPIVVERVRLRDKDIAIEGNFELPQLARLDLEDQIFVVAFVRSHGSIKEMERVFGVSYPTIKSRLSRIADSLDFVETNPTPSRAEIFERLQQGEISAEEAIRELEALK